VGAITPDADVLIGLLDEKDAHHDRAIALLEHHHDHDLVLAATTYSEILVRPLRNGTEAIVEGFLDDVRATIVPIDRVIAREAAELRTSHTALRLHDALALATSRAHGTTFLTFDRRLARLA
jgi:predicted nucleic acid-binding protein